MRYDLVMQFRRVGLALCFAGALSTSACGDDESGGDGGSGGSSTGGSSTGGTSTGGTSTGGGSTGGGGMSAAGPCAATACSDASPDAACETCIDAECGAEIASCIADTTDPAANCIGCAEVLGDGSFDDACPAGKTLFADILMCICGDGTTAGGCS